MFYSYSYMYCWHSKLTPVNKLHTSIIIISLFTVQGMRTLPSSACNLLQRLSFRRNCYLQMGSLFCKAQRTQSRSLSKMKPCNSMGLKRTTLWKLQMVLKFTEMQELKKDNEFLKYSILKSSAIAPTLTLQIRLRTLQTFESWS